MKKYNDDNIFASFRIDDFDFMKLIENGDKRINQIEKPTQTR